MSYKHYFCHKCNTEVARLTVDSGNKLRKGMAMVCSTCFKKLTNSSTAYNDEGHRMFKEFFSNKL